MEIGADDEGVASSEGYYDDDDEIVQVEDDQASKACPKFIEDEASDEGSYLENDQSVGDDGLSSDDEDMTIESSLSKRLI